MNKYIKEQRPYINLIFDASQHLKLSTLPQTTACMLYHHAVRKEKELNHPKIDRYLVSSTCLYLACKITEEPIKIRDMVNAIYRLIHPDSKPLDISTPYWNLRDSITTCELMLLRLFNFVVIFDTPHKYMLHYLQLIEDWTTDIVEFRGCRFSQLCWNVVNDACYSPLIYDASPQMLSAAIIYFVLQSTMLQINEHQDGKRWFQVFCGDEIKEKDLEKLVCIMFQVYDEVEDVNTDG